jgi:lia operon protein LiaG
VTRPLRFLATALVLATAPLASLQAQQAERFELSGARLELYNLIGTLQVAPSTGTTAVAEITRAGKDGPKLTVQNANGTLSVLYPGSEFTYPAMGGNAETNLRVRDDGTFGDRYGDRSNRDGGRKVTITSRAGGLAAWADIRLLLPRGAQVDLNLGVGKVTLANVDGSIRVQTASGDVAGTGTAGSLSIDTGSGDVTLAGHDGGLSVDTGSGDITLSDIKTGDLSLDTGSGDVRVDGVTATVLSVDTGSGDVTATAATVGNVEIDTGSGDIRIGLTGDVSELSVDTGSGDVEVSAPKSLGATVEIETSSGDITTEFPLQVTRKGRDGLRGTIGDGQGRITIDTASGDVTLKQRP